MSLTLHIVFGSRDSDLVYWKSSIPQNCFNYYVNRIIESERNKEIAVLPIPAQRGTECRKLSIHLTFRSASDIRFVRSFPKRKRGLYLKEIMRKHIRENYRRLNAGDSDATSETPIAELEDNTEIISPIEAHPDEPEKEVKGIGVAEEEEEKSEEYKKFLREMAGY